MRRSRRLRHGRKHLRKHRPPRPRMPDSPPFPARCADERVDGALVHLWQNWVHDDCPGIAELPEEATETREAARCAQRASTTTSEGELGDLSRSRWAWVRLTVANNDHVSASALWGDGIVSLGLCGDDDPFVQIAALLALPEPPQALVDVIESSASTQAPQP